MSLKWLITKGRNPEHRYTRTPGLYYSCIYEEAVRTVQDNDTEGKQTRSINVRLELSLLDVQLGVSFNRGAVGVLKEETSRYFLYLVLFITCMLLRTVRYTVYDAYHLL